MAVKYGNLPLGQVYELIISIIGRDATLAIADEHGIFETKNDKGKYLDRAFTEEDRSFVHLRPSEKTSPLEIARKFFEIAEKKSLERGYGFPCYIKHLFIFFIRTFRHALSEITPYEKQTKDTALHLFNWFLGHLGCGIQDPENDKTFFVSKDFIKDLLKDSYENIFNDVYKNPKLSPDVPKDKKQSKRDMLYEYIKGFYKWEVLGDFEQAIKRAIDKCCKDNTNAPWIGEKGNWYKFKAILDYINSKGEKELVHRLIGLYLLKNTETALKEICGIDQKDIFHIKQDILLWANDKLPDEPQNETQCFLMTAGKYNGNDLSMLQNDFINPDYQTQIAVIRECDKYLRGEKTINPVKAEQLIKIMEGNCPNCKVFFASWARARLAVLSCKFDGSVEDEEFQKKALKYYHEAFEKGRNFAGEYLKAFLEESIAATVYFNRRRIQDIPKVIDPKNTLKTPITDDVKEKENREASYGAKQYYEYGYALNFFEQESSETYFLHFHAEEHFWKVFHVHQFIHSQLVEQKYNEDKFKTKGIHIIEGGKEGLEQYLTTQKERLENISEKKINDRMEIIPGHNIQYTPLTIAIQRGHLDIVDKYLNKYSNSLDVTIINTNGSTALLEALTQYKNYRFFQKGEQTAERYKKIIIELIRRSPVDSLYAETVKNHISVLEEAINTFDIEVVMAIVEKKDFNIQELIINWQELSPLYYAVMRLYEVQQAILIGYIDPNKYNVNWKNYDVPEMFNEDKLPYWNQQISATIQEKKENTYLSIGFESIWEQEKKEINDIIQYLIEKTNDVDAFAKPTIEDKRDFTNVLSLAVEHDFADICRKLIEKGADPARVFRYNGKPYNSPFIRAVWFKSWETLKLLLTDFKDKVKPIINERFTEELYTAAHLLFKDKYEINRDNLKLFVPLFKAAGADFNIPNIGGITVRQILCDDFE